jgi:hypothetical protein
MAEEKRGGLSPNVSLGVCLFNYRFLRRGRGCSRQRRPLSVAPRTRRPHVPPVRSPRNVRPARRSAPVAGAVNARRLTKISTQGLGGGDRSARTGDSPLSHRNRSPPCAGNGVLLRRDRPAKAGSSPNRDRFRDAPKVRKLRHPRTNCEIACEGPNPKTGWWAHQGSNLGPDG